MNHQMNADNYIGKLALILEAFPRLDREGILDRFAREVASIEGVLDFGLACRAGTTGEGARDFHLTLWSASADTDALLAEVEETLPLDLAAEDAEPDGETFRILPRILPRPGASAAVSPRATDYSCIPLVIQDPRTGRTPIGALCFWLDTPVTEYAPKHQAPFAYLAGLVRATLVVLDNRILSEERRVSLERKESIHEANRAFQERCRTVRDLLHEAATRCAALVRADRVEILAYSKRFRHFNLEFAAAPGDPAGRLAGPERIFLEDGDLYRGARDSGLSVRLEPPDSSFATLPAAPEPVLDLSHPYGRSALFPITTGEALAAVCVVSFADGMRRLDEAEKRALELLLDQVGHSLRHLRQIAADNRALRQQEALLKLNGELLRSLFGDEPLDGLLSRLATQAFTLGLDQDPAAGNLRSFEAGILEESDGVYRCTGEGSPAGRACDASMRIPAAALDAALDRRDDAPLLSADDPDASRLARPEGGHFLAFPVALVRYVRADGTKRLFFASGAAPESPLFRTVASLARNAVEGARLRLAADDKKRLDAQLELARAVQARLIPDGSPARLPVEVDGFWLPTRAVGGDYYDILPFADGSACLLIADVSGKGPAAALVMVMMRTLARSHAARFSDPGDLLAFLNDAMAGELDVYSFITAACLRIGADGACRVANGGHNPTLLFRASTGAVEQFPSDQPPLGIARGQKFDIRTFEIKPDDRILLYTDGATEAKDERGEFFGEERLRASFAASARGGVPATLAGLKEDIFLRHCRTAPEAAALHDDATLVVAGLRAAAHAGRDPSAGTEGEDR